MIKNHGDGWHSAVLRTLPLSGSLNRKICGSLHSGLHISSIR